MSALVVYDRTGLWEDAVPDGDNLWLSPEALNRHTGWELKPEGACLGEVCVPVPASAAESYLGQDNRFNLAAFAKLIGKPVVHSDQGDVWVFGDVAADRQSALLSLEAPDFELPDLQGRVHRLSDYRGQKVFLFAWASW